MKKTVMLGILIVGMGVSCQKKSESKEENAPETSEAVSVEDAAKEPVIERVEFDPASIAVTDKTGGEFPYVKLPDGYKFSDPRKSHGEGEKKDLDREYFYNKGFYTMQEGKTYKADIGIDKDVKDKKFSALELQRGLDEQIEAAGGIKINNGEKLQTGETDWLKAKDADAYISGYLHSANNWDNVHTFVIRRADKVIWIQYNLGVDRGYLTVMDTKAVAE